MALQPGGTKTTGTRELLWHSYESNFTSSALGARLCNKFECYTFKNIATFLEYNEIICYQMQKNEF